jgi:hypothetical protein
VIAGLLAPVHVLGISHGAVHFAPFRTLLLELALPLINVALEDGRTARPLPLCARLGRRARHADSHDDAQQCSLADVHRPLDQFRIPRT